MVLAVVAGHATAAARCVSGAPKWPPSHDVGAASSPTPESFPVSIVPESSLGAETSGRLAAASPETPASFTGPVLDALLELHPLAPKSAVAKTAVAKVACQSFMSLFE